MYTLEEHKQLWIDAGIEYGLCLCGCGENTKIAKNNSYTQKMLKGEPKRRKSGHKGQKCGPNNTFECSLCHSYKDSSEFSSDISRKFGISNACKICDSRRSLNYRNKIDSFGVKNSRKIELKWKYNLTISEYNKIMEGQNNCCDICGVSFEETKACVDHCHVTNNVRKLLCSHCNTGIGLFRDNPEVMRKAADYIEKHLTGGRAGGTILSEG